MQNNQYIWSECGWYGIMWEGKLYNREDYLQSGEGADVSDARLALNAFMRHGADAVKGFNGAFAFVICEILGGTRRLYLFRDHLGVKSLFYTVKDKKLHFGVTLKSLFASPDVSPVIDRNYYREVFGLGPARTPGSGVFKDVCEVLPGHYVEFVDTEGIIKSIKYWGLSSHPHTDSYEATVAKVRSLVTDSIRRQVLYSLERGEAVCSMLSGGIDSSIVTAVAAGILAERGQVLPTFSFDFAGNDEHFAANAFQPERDRPFVERMLRDYKLNHTYLECAASDLADCLDAAADARGLPGMGDIDASLLYFCEAIRRHGGGVALTGECADELFGGYPWFYREELMNVDGFPWSNDLDMRTFLLEDDFRESLNLPEWVGERYAESLSQVPRLSGEVGGGVDSRRREIGYLTQQWFMQTLLTRADAMSSHAGLSMCVPFADYRLAEYLWNVPWEYKCRGGIIKAKQEQLGGQALPARELLDGGVAKGLLREAFADLLPDELLNRKKSPFPKTYNPAYTRLLRERLRGILHDTSSPLAGLLNREKALEFISELQPQSLDRPWFGQLMAGPQMMAYLIQVNHLLSRNS
jgi:asparagine synthase (glutamine-hydrolysing)